MSHPLFLGYDFSVSLRPPPMPANSSYLMAANKGKKKPKAGKKEVKKGMKK
jgi:hypothetical protein